MNDERIEIPERPVDDPACWTSAELGASTIMPATLMGDVGTIAVIADPQGAVFALYQPVSSRG